MARKKASLIDNIVRDAARQAFSVIGAIAKQNARTSAKKKDNRIKVTVIDKPIPAPIPTPAALPQFNKESNAKQITAALVKMGFAQYDIEQAVETVGVAEIELMDKEQALRSTLSIINVK